MRRRSLSVAAAIALSLGLAAGPGCTWSDLDAEFLAAMPERTDLHVHPPTETASTQQGLQSADLGQRQSALKADAFLNLHNMATQLNAWIDGLTGGLDLVRQHAPTVRDEDRRVWGPWADRDHPGLQVRVVVVRGAEQYEYAVEWSPEGGEGEFVPVVTGWFKGETAKGGTGEFTLHMDRAREVGVAGPDADPKFEVQLFTLGYDRSESAVAVALTELLLETESGDTKTLSFRHQRNADQGGEFSYVFTMPTNGYEVSASAQWLPSRAGRVDGTGYSTFFQKVVAHHAECWDENLEVVYFLKDYDCGPLKGPCSYGSESDCAILAPAGP